MDKEWQQIEGFKRFARVYDSTQASSRFLIEFTRLIRQSFKAFGGHRPLPGGTGWGSNRDTTIKPPSRKRAAWLPSAKLGRCASPSSPSLLTDGRRAVWHYFRRHGPCQAPGLPDSASRARRPCDHTHLAWITMSGLWPLKRETQALGEEEKEAVGRRGEGKKKKHRLNLLLVPKSQFHSGSSIALTRSGWQREFVSPPPHPPPSPSSSHPNLEITFSAAGARALPYPFQPPPPPRLPATLPAWLSTER